MQTLPKISIVVPNLNGANTLGDTLQSLIDQRYPHLQIIVSDGGSTDGSVAIIKTFEPNIAWWISERDRGQSDAINKGLAVSDGEIVNWLCSDDLLEPGCLQFVGEAFAADANLGVLLGSAAHGGLHGEATSYSRPTLADWNVMPVRNLVPQPACFYRRSLLTRHPPLDESLHYVMDFDLWCQFKHQGATVRVSDRVLARTRVDGHNKMSTGGVKIGAEMVRVYERYVSESVSLARLYQRFMFPLDQFRARHPGAVSRIGVRGLKLAFQLAVSPFYGYRRSRAMNWSAYT